MPVRLLSAILGIAAGALCFSTSTTSASDGDAAAAAPLTIAAPTDYPDVKLSNQGSNGRVAFSPVDPRHLAVAIDDDPECSVRASADGGKTWQRPVRLPRLPGTDCSSRYGNGRPVVAYATNGRLLYAAHRYRTFDPTYTTGVAVSVSADHGATWSAPKSVFERPEEYDDIGVCDLHLVVAPDGPRVSVFTLFCGYSTVRTYLMSTVDQGKNWSAPKKITETFKESFDGDWTQFSWALGRGGVILVARAFWNNGGPGTAIFVGKSTDSGTTIAYNVADSDSELWLDDPDIKIGAAGTAQLVYRKGDGIFYKFSLPPYDTWSAEPVRLDEQNPRGSPTEPRLALGACAGSSVLHVTWVERLNAAKGGVFYSRKVARPGYPWSQPLKIGTFAQGEWYEFVESDLAAAGPRAFSVFTGYPTPPQIMHVGGSRVSSGVTCE